MKDGAFPVRKLLSFHRFFLMFRHIRHSPWADDARGVEMRVEPCQRICTLDQGLQPGLLQHTWEIYGDKDKSKSMGFLRYVHPNIHNIWISRLDDMYDAIFDGMNIHLQLFWCELEGSWALTHRLVWEWFNQHSHWFWLSAKSHRPKAILLPEGHLCWLLQHMSLSWNWVQPFYIVLWGK